MSTRPAAASPASLSRTRLARRARLLTEAQALFLDEGYHATTMERVAAEAGVSKATLYKYFQDKDALFLDLVREGYLAPDYRLLDQLHETLSQTIAQVRRHGSREDVRQAILRLLTLSSQRRNDAFYRILIELAFSRPDLLRAARRELTRGRSAFPAQAAAALPAGLDGEALMHLLFAAITGYSVFEDAVFGRERIDPERLADTFATLIWAAIE